MSNMKKCFVFLMIFVHSIFLFGCSSGTSDISGNPDPEPIKAEEQNIHEFLNIELDLSYDSIIAKTEKDTYPLNVDQITCTVQNNNVGKGFYLYEIPFVEQRIDGKWVRLYYNSDRLEVAQWQFCGIEGNTTEPNSSQYVVKLKDINATLIPGEYRLVVFTAQKKVYATFTLTE